MPKMSKRALEIRQRWMNENPELFEEWSHDEVKVNFINALAQVHADDEDEWFRRSLFKEISMSEDSLKKQAGEKK